MAEKARGHIFISGKVQGVFFRDNTRNKARLLGLFGWIRNLPDGRVEAVFEGEKEKIEEILKWLREGPEMADVDGLSVEWQDYKGEFTNFEIRY